MSHEDDFGVFKAGGIAAITAGVFAILLFVALMAFYSTVGGPASQGEQIFSQIANNRILFISLTITGLLLYLFLVPTVAALYFALRKVTHTFALLGSAFLAISIVGFLIFQSLLFGLLTLTERYAASGGSGVSLIGAAEAISAIQNPLFAVSNLLAITGMILLGAGMLKGIFGKATGWLGIGIGLIGFVGMTIPALGILAAVVDVVLGLWLIVVGLKMYRLNPIQLMSGAKSSQIVGESSFPSLLKGFDD